MLYDHDAQGGKAEAQVVFDSLAVGEAQGSYAADLLTAMDGDHIKVARIKGNPGEYGTLKYTEGQDKYIQPLIDSGKIDVVCDQNITNWDPVEGQAYIEDCLAKNDNDLDMIISMNDGLAGGSIAALTTQGLEGSVIVTGGQDANLDAVQFIVQGKLQNTVFKNLAVEADAAAQVVAAILSGDGVPEDLVTGEIDNDFMKVPAVFLPVQNVDIENLQDLVDAGVWTWEEMCKGGEDTEVCKQNL